jgi:hypothetical protein
MKDSCPGFPGLTRDFDDIGNNTKVVDSRWRQCSHHSNIVHFQLTLPYQKHIDETDKLLVTRRIDDQDQRECQDGARLA